MPGHKPTLSDTDPATATAAAATAAAEAQDQRNPHASASKWRHEESTAFARHAAAAAMKQQQQPQQPQQKPQAAPVAARDEEGPRSDTRDLTAFLNASRVEPEAGASAEAARSKPLVVGGADAPAGGATEGASTGAAAAGAPAAAAATTPPSDGRDILCGPLLNYRRMEGGNQWFGSVLVVTRGVGAAPSFVPSILLRRVADAQADTDDDPGQEIFGTCLYADPRSTFWRFDVVVPLGAAETAWQYALPPSMRFASATQARTNVFVVPAATQAMRLLFYSCNGFSVGTDEDAWSGPALWKDVLRAHAARPFHVMLGGGDQIYNDSIRVAGPLREWTAIGNPHKRRAYRFTEDLRRRVDDFYLNNYLRWYATEPFAAANGQIAQLNIWDDHDIIDGFGSYVDEFMRCDMFRGIGGSAQKYYMLFQHHLPPPATTFTSDAPEKGPARDAQQLVDTYVAPPMVEPSYIIGAKPGPYVSEHSHSMYCQLGARMAFLGIDARTERTRHQVNYPETYERIFARVDRELAAAAAAGAPIRHLILLLGIPIAYPRLTWLENVFNSPVMGPVKFLHRRFGVGGGFINSFDGSVDLLDDLDDHYTARTHKAERNWLVERLQTLSAAHSVRVTILGGDVHLAALGRFYANPALGVPAEQDCRFVVNVVSSAITNKPPPAAIANLLARRNRIHHLNHDTDETLFKLFDKDPGTSTRTAAHNKVTMPSRNYAILTENEPEGVAAGVNGVNGEGVNGHVNWVNGGHVNGDSNGTADAAPAATAETTTAAPTDADRVGRPEAPPIPPDEPAPRATSLFGRRSASRKRAAAARPATAGASSLPPSSHFGKDGHHALHAGEVGAGTQHRAAHAATHGRAHDGSLDVCLCVETDQHDAEGRTEGYGLTVPALDYRGAALPVPAMPRHHFRRSVGSRPTTAGGEA